MWKGEGSRHVLGENLRIDLEKRLDKEGGGYLSFLQAKGEELRRKQVIMLVWGVSCSKRKNQNPQG